jgi:hypothetical protein
MVGIRVSKRSRKLSGLVASGASRMGVSDVMATAVTAL